MHKSKSLAGLSPRRFRVPGAAAQGLNNVIRRRIFDSIVWSLSLLFAFGLLVDSALADSREGPAGNATWKAECGTCHLAYPPKLLPAPAWRRVMAGLERHFGTDASIDARAAAEISAFLETHAGRDRHAEAGQETMRITESAWFKRQHGELIPTVWSHRLVKSPVNCGACHAGAERGDFSEHRTWFRTRSSGWYASAGLGYTGF